MSDWQSDNDLNSIRNSCNVSLQHSIRSGQNSQSEHYKTKSNRNVSACDTKPDSSNQVSFPHTHTHCLYVVLFVAQLQYLDTSQDQKRSRSLLWMEEAWLWYGPDDPVSLDHVRQASAYIILCHFDGHSQAGAKAVSTALFHLPAGQVI